MLSWVRVIFHVDNLLLASSFLFFIYLFYAVEVLDFMLAEFSLLSVSWVSPIWFGRVSLDGTYYFFVKHIKKSWNMIVIMRIA